MPEKNLLKHYPKTTRPFALRALLKTQKDNSSSNQDLCFEYLLINRVREYGREYFDGDRLYGYGGYYYDPRYWTMTVKEFRETYKLTPNCRILDVGCAKGFLLHDFKNELPDSFVAGFDVSSYAIANAIETVKPYLRIGNAKDLPLDRNSFDLAVSINTVDHLPLEDCKKAIQEIQRVSRNSFISVNAWRNEQERKTMLSWNLTSQTIMHVEDWIRLFEDVGYTGDYYWFFAEG